MENRKILKRSRSSFFPLSRILATYFTSTSNLKLPLRLFLKKIVFSPNVEISVSPYTLRNRSYPLNFSFLRIPSSNSLPHRDPMKYVNERIDGKVDFRKRYRSSRGRRDGGWFSAGGSGTTPGSGEQLRGKKLEPVSGKKFLICGIIKGDGAKSITDSTPLSENREFHLASTIPPPLPRYARLILSTFPRCKLWWCVG